MTVTSLHVTSARIGIGSWQLWLSSENLAAEKLVHSGCRKCSPRNTKEPRKTYVQNICSTVRKKCISVRNNYRWWILSSSLWPTDEKTIGWRQLSPHEKKSKVHTCVGKVMANVLWDSEGILLLEFLERGAVINSESYVQTLSKLKRQICRVQPNRRWIKFLCCMTIPGHTLVCAQGWQLQWWGGLFSLVFPTVWIRHIRFSSLWPTEGCTLRMLFCRWWWAKI